MTGIHVRFEVEPDDFLADLTNAAYQVALRYGLRAPFIDVELDLQKAIYEVIRNDIRTGSAEYLLSQDTHESLAFEHWS